MSLQPQAIYVVPEDTARVAHIPGAGHNIRRDRYEPYRAAVAAFLGEVLA